MKGMTKPQQTAARRAIKAGGQTLVGWARANKFKESNVISVLYRDYGRAQILTPTAEEIVGRLREQGLVGDRA